MFADAACVEASALCRRAARLRHSLGKAYVYGIGLLLVFVFVFLWSSAPPNIAYLSSLDAELDPERSWLPYEFEGAEANREPCEYPVLSSCEQLAERVQYLTACFDVPHVTLYTNRDGCLADFLHVLHTRATQKVELPFVKKGAHLLAVLSMTPRHCVM